MKGKTLGHGSVVVFAVTALAITLAGTLFIGCAKTSGQKGTTEYVATSAGEFEVFTGEFENTAYYREHLPGSLAVLPFKDAEEEFYSFKLEEETPAVIVRRAMYNHFASLPFNDLELSETDLRLKNAGITELEQIHDLLEKDPAKLKSILGVDAAVTGEVTHFDRIFLGIYSQVAVGCEVKMWDLESGELLWRAKNVARSHAGDLTLSPLGLVMAAINAAWNLGENEMMTQTDQLFREIVSTIYIPEAMWAARPPKPDLNLFTVLNPGTPFQAGQKVSFRLIGDPGCTAYADLVGFKSSIEMQPVPSAVKAALHKEVLAAIVKNYKETGHELTPELLAAIKDQLASREIYEGSYTVEPGEQRYGLLAKGYLVNAGGGQAVSLDTVHSVDVDGLPPEPPSGLAAKSLDGKIELVWFSREQTDLAGYHILMSENALSGYKQIASSEEPGMVIEGVENFAPLHFKVAAIDKAGNLSPLSASVKGVALPEKDLYFLPQPGPALSGFITGKVLLTAAKSPYTVRQNLVIEKGATMFIEPGAVVLFGADAGLTVKGELLAYGRPGATISLRPESDSSAPGAWRGITFDSSGRCVLSGAVIDRAAVGVTVISAAPQLKGVIIKRSSQAGMHLKDNAKAQAACCLFTRNEGQGALLIEGRGIDTQIRASSFVDNQPFQVQSYTPLTMDLSGNYWGAPMPDPNAFLGEVVWLPALSEPPKTCTPAESAR